MVTCYVKYVIDPYKTAEFERYSKMWIPLVGKFGGQHHGYFLPAYERYREASLNDSDCQAAFKYAEETRCVISCERSFMRPVLG
ncbi:NIPSNAP family protein [Marinobacter halodurans]|uniref:NIPSNAP family protein n=1 Tax=Marinobacter halodurans TaxID=2528979 RepID=A0ABY1ZPS7_9GAMM|nr:NIPSNAP family protein [Marinobacter halodurans]TBW58603.1 NIPSNAP family protein [Marinobacter halodurans]